MYLQGQEWTHFKPARTEVGFTLVADTIWAVANPQGLQKMHRQTGEILAQLGNPGFLDNVYNFDQVVQAPGGAIWIGQRNRLFIWHQNSWQVANLPPLASLFTPNKALLPVGPHQGWALFATQLWWYDGGQWRDSLGFHEAGNQEAVHAAALDASGALWLMLDTGLLRLYGSERDTFPLDALPASPVHFMQGKAPEGVYFGYGESRFETLYQFSPSGGLDAISLPEPAVQLSLDEQQQPWLLMGDSIKRLTNGQFDRGRFWPGDWANSFRFAIDRAQNLWSNPFNYHDASSLLIRTSPDGQIKHFKPLGHGLWIKRAKQLVQDTLGRIYQSFPYGPISRFDPRNGSWEVMPPPQADFPYLFTWHQLKVSPSGDIWAIGESFRHPNVALRKPMLLRFDLLQDTWVIEARESGYQRLRQDLSFDQNGNPIIHRRGTPLVFEEGVLREIQQDVNLYGTWIGPVWDQKGQAWFTRWEGFSSQKIFRARDGEWEEQDFLPLHGQDLVSLWVDASDVKWFASRRSLMRYDDSYSKTLGLDTSVVSAEMLGLLPQETIVQVEVGPEGHAWLLTNLARVIRYSCATSQVFTSPDTDQYPAVFGLTDMLITPQGEIYLSDEERGLYRCRVLGGLPAADPCQTARRVLGDTWQLYPNPVQDRLTLVAGNPGLGGVRLRWRDLSGRELGTQTFEYQHPGIELLLPDQFPSGIYLLELQVGGTQEMHKVHVRR